MMKKLALFGLVLFITGSIGVLVFRNEIYQIGVGTEIDERIAFTDAEFEMVIVEADVADVRFTPTDRDHIEVSLTGSVDDSSENVLTVDEDSQVLTVNIKQDQMFFFNFFPKSNNLTLEVKLPESFTGQLEANIGVGELELENLMLTQLLTKVNVGSVIINQVELDSANVIANVGDIDIANVTGDWSVEADVGDVNIDLLAPIDQLDVETNIGNVKIHLPETGIEDYQLQLQADLGDISLNGDKVGTGDVGSSYIQQSTSGQRLSVYSDIGDIKIDWKQ
ncbi:Putative adhesin [Amphibacillus marinus]|uniref:Putative adhesin n=2 Tax=Amphibacillus marinus TaxID=872970 RepID=A0A1H8MWY7_9BACI|nr:Putative adhesin [Amphibacillus marinus]